VVIQTFARAGKQIIKHMPHGQNRGSGINRASRGWYCPDFASNLCMTLKQSDLSACGLQSHSAGKSRNPGTDDGDAHAAFGVRR